MIVQVKLFAAARQAVDRESVEVELDQVSTVRDLRHALVQQYPALAQWEPHLLIAVDQQYARQEDAIAPGQEIACFPPVSGG